MKFSKWTLVRNIWYSPLNGMALLNIRMILDILSHFSIFLKGAVTLVDLGWSSLNFGPSENTKVVLNNSTRWDHPLHLVSGAVCTSCGSGPPSWSVPTVWHRPQFRTKKSHQYLHLMETLMFMMVTLCLCQNCAAMLIWPSKGSNTFSFVYSHDLFKTYINWDFLKNQFMIFKGIYCLLLPLRGQVKTKYHKSFPQSVVMETWCSPSAVLGPEWKQTLMRKFHSSLVEELLMVCFLFGGWTLIVHQKSWPHHPHTFICMD